MICIQRMFHAASIATLLLSGACLASPHNGQLMDGTLQDEVQFSGFAQHEGGMVVIEAKNRQSGQWEAVGEATATLEVNYGGDTLYYWSLSAPVYDPSDPDTACRLSANCTVPAGDVSATLRAREPGGDLDALISFDDGGVDCVRDLVDNEDEGWLEAGWTCRGSTSPQITIRWLS